MHNSDAAQLLSVENDDTGYYVNVSGSASVAIDVTAIPEGQLAGASDKITTTTNSPRGYQLYISASPNYLYLDGDSSNSGPSTKFSPIGGDFSSATVLGNNTWGFAFNSSNAGVVSNNFASASDYTADVPTSSAVYASVPTSATMVQKVENANIPNGTDLDVYYGVKASTSLLSGTYSGTITYTALSDGVNSNADFMQDFTTTQCSALTESKADAVNEIELMDKRDLKWYRVAKLADGNCWMVQNLALDGGITLTPDDSNVTQNRPLRANITDEASADDKIQIYSGVAENTTTSTNSNGHALISDEKYGNLYNWLAATAGTGSADTTGTAYESICPKGWRLPDNTGNKSWSNLLGQYGYPTTNKSQDSSSPQYDPDTYTYIEDMQKAPLYIPLAGSYYSAAHNQEHLAYLWSRAAYDTGTYAYHFFFHADHGAFAPQHGDYTSSGLSVRCVFEGSTIENNMFMQDINLTMCDSLAESTASVDNRRTVIDGRDNKTYKISKLADGNCWMVQNLALDGGRTLQPTDSNVTQNHTLPTNITYGQTREHGDGLIYSGFANTTTTTAANSYVVVSDSPYGNIYDHYAASAMTGKIDSSDTTYESICPLNWRVPDVNGNKSAANLMGKYGYPTVDTTVSENANLPAYIVAIQKAPIYWVMAGYYNPNNGVAYDQGLSGRILSRTTAISLSSGHIYSAFFDTRVGTELFHWNPQFDDTPKRYGISVRCILGE